MVVAVPRELDLHLTARIARERYEAQLSLAYRPGGELVVLGGDESRAPARPRPRAAWWSHLATKHDWIEALLGRGSRRAHARARAPARPERLDEVIAEIAMGRSIVEGEQRSAGWAAAKSSAVGHRRRHSNSKTPQALAVPPRNLNWASHEPQPTPPTGDLPSTR